MNHAVLLRCFATLVLALSALAPREAAAHPQHYSQSAYLTLEPGRATLELELSPGSKVAEAVARLIDTNGDALVDEAEERTYAGALLADLSLEIDGQRRELLVTNHAIPPPDQLATGENKLSFAFVTTFPPLAPGPHTARFWNGHHPVESVYMAHAFTQTTQVVLEKQTRDASMQTLLTSYRVEGGRGAAVGDKGWDKGWDKGGRLGALALGLSFAGALGACFVKARRRDRSRSKR